MKSLWESRIDQAKAPAEVSSKRWKSLEVITASLSLPKDQTDLQLTSPPEDYSRSLDRRRLKEQQRADSNANGSVTSGRISQLSKGRSVDNLSAARGRSPHMWFDTQRIKEAISHESIGDAGQTKSMWEKMSDTNASPRRNGADHTNSATLPRHHKVYDHQGNNNNSNISKTNGKRLTEASEEIRENLNVIEREIEDYKQREREMKAQGILKPFERRNITGTPVVQQSYSQEFHISQPPPSAGRMTGEEDFEMEKELLLLYIRSKPQVLESLGVHLPSELKKGSGAPSYGPKVELRPVGESYPLQRSTNRAMEDSVSSYNGSNNSTLERIPSHLKGNAGRYQKNVRGTTVVNKRITSRKPSFDSVRDSPVQKRSSSANNGEDLDNGRKHIGPRPTENLILYEIMEQREREEELRRSRSSLGLPSLDDILTNWRSATPTFHSPGFTLKSSQSFDHLTHAVENEIMEQSYRQRQPLSTSMDQLHLAEMSAYDPYRSSNFASLNRPAKQTKMERNIPINYNGAEPEGYKSVSRVQLVPPNHQQQHQQQQSNNEAKPMIVRQPSALSTGAAGSAQLPRMYSLLRSPVEKSFEKLVKQAGSSRPVVEIPPTYRRRVEFVPVRLIVEVESITHLMANFYLS